jgi:hypothetical protein
MPPKTFHTRAQRLAAARRAIFNRAYDKTTRAISEDINRMILGGLSRKEGNAKIAERIEKKYPEVSAARIVRNETHSIESLMREVNFLESDPNAMMLYVWQVVRDKRLTPICKRIADRAKSGVTMDRLKEIIAEEADARTYRAANPYVPHIGCRSVMRRKYQ